MARDITPVVLAGQNYIERNEPSRAQVHHVFYRCIRSVVQLLLPRYGTSLHDAPSYGTVTKRIIDTILNGCKASPRGSIERSVLREVMASCREDAQVEKLFHMYSQDFSMDGANIEICTLTEQEGINVTWATPDRPRGNISVQIVGMRDAAVGAEFRHSWNVVALSDCVPFTSACTEANEGTVLPSKRIKLSRGMRSSLSACRTDWATVMTVSCIPRRKHSRE